MFSENSDTILKYSNGVLSKFLTGPLFKISKAGLSNMFLSRETKVDCIPPDLTHFWYICCDFFDNPDLPIVKVIAPSNELHKGTNPYLLNTAADTVSLIIFANTKSGDAVAPALNHLAGAFNLNILI